MNSWNLFLRCPEKFRLQKKKKKRKKKNTNKCSLAVSCYTKNYIVKEFQGKCLYVIMQNMFLGPNNRGSPIGFLGSGIWLF